jgi:hypothetical protein
MESRPSVILIREYDQQLTGSGCCGRLAGDFAICAGEPVFAERRLIMERMGSVYRKLEERFGDEIEIQVVDPRNFGLLFLLFRDIWAFRVGWRSAMHTLTRVGTHAVVVNGRLADRTDHPDPESIAAMVAGTPSGHRAAPHSPSSLVR